MNEYYSLCVQTQRLEGRAGNEVRNRCQEGKHVCVRDSSVNFISFIIRLGERDPQDGCGGQIRFVIWQHVTG